MRELIDEVQCDSNGYIRLKLKGELIRCGECKYFDRIEPNHPYGYCHAAKHGYQTSRWEISIYRKCKEDFYCADGERKENDDVRS